MATNQAGRAIRDGLARLWRREQPTLAFALGGGGARGLAHIGVVKVLEQAGIRPDAVAGTSMGGLVAIGWAAGMSASDMANLARHTRVSDVVGLDRTGMGMANGERIGALIANAVGFERMEALPVPCAVVATDIRSGARWVMDRGPIATAARATTAIAGIFSPVVDGERLLVDGGMVAPLPVEEARALGPRHVIAVDVTAGRDRVLVAEPTLGLVPRAVASSLAVLRVFGRERAVDVVVKSFELQAAELVRLTLECTKPDLVIRPLVGHLRMDQFDHYAEAIEAGAEAAREALPAIRHMLA